jgi:hypothetical protein
MRFKEGLFELTKEQENTVKMMYNGKLIKCLVAPYHSYSDLESVIPYTKSTFLFPEREMSDGQANSLISNLVESDLDNIIIITTHMGIILDMVDGVHVLTQNGTIVDGKTKTFMANIHNIRYNLLENPKHRNGTEQIEKSKGVTEINKIIDKINELNGSSISQEEYNELKVKVDMIGEDVIRNTLTEMIREISISKTTLSKNLTLLDKLIDAYSQNESDPEKYKEITYKLVELYRLQGLSDQDIMLKI